MDWNWSSASTSHRAMEYYQRILSRMSSLVGQHTSSILTTLENKLTRARFHLILYLSRIIFEKRSSVLWTRTGTRSSHVLYNGTFFYALLKTSSLHWNKEENCYLSLMKCKISSVLIGRSKLVNEHEILSIIYHRMKKQLFFIKIFVRFIARLQQITTNHW